MDYPHIPKKSSALERARVAEDLLEKLLAHAGWSVESGPPEPGKFSPDMFARRHAVEYVVEVKAGAEGRGDRLIPLFAQAVLQSVHAAANNPKSVPLAVVAAPKISARAAKQVIEFAKEYAPNAAAGVIDFQGLRLFHGPQLEELNVHAEAPASMAAPRLRESGQLFSDLNQWMLKVLLAPELPEALLNAPRGQYRNASELAAAAQVSVMSAFRFVRLLQNEGYLHESAPHLKLVRREDLFNRWQALGRRSAKEQPMRLVIKGDPLAPLRKLPKNVRACLALFAAADALHLGFVQGVPRYVYVPQVPADVVLRKNLRPCAPGDLPDYIFRQAPAPESVFRGMVRDDGVPVSDVVQVWIDVAGHPSRGREQADIIRKRVLQSVIEGGN